MPHGVYSVLTHGRWYSMLLLTAGLFGGVVGNFTKAIAFIRRSTWHPFNAVLSQLLRESWRPSANVASYRKAKT